jgi:hypothetical protein
MKKLLIILLLLFSSCGNNPFNPEVRDYTSFYGFLNDMGETGDIKKWFEKYCAYDDAYVGKVRGKGTVIRRAALNMFVEKRGVCLHYAAMYAYAAKWHGKRSGILVVGDHVYGWIEEGGGITKTDNWEVYRLRYGTFEEMVAKQKGVFSVFDSSGEWIAGQYAVLR